MTIQEYRDNHGGWNTIGDHYGHSKCPRWISSDVDIDQLYEIALHGCSTGVYMPAITYHVARETMNTHGEDVMTFLRTAYADDVPQPDRVETWGGIASYYLSLAVEAYASDVLTDLGVEY